MNFGLLFLSLTLWATSGIQNVNQMEDNDLLETEQRLGRVQSVLHGTETEVSSNDGRSESTQQRLPGSLQERFPLHDYPPNRRPTRTVSSPGSSPRRRLSINATHPNASSSPFPSSGQEGTEGDDPLDRSRRKKQQQKKRRRRGRAHRRPARRNDISLWIDEEQVKMFSGYNMEIYAIVNGKVMPYILDPEFEEQLPIIPSEVKHVNFTWRSARKRYFYNFDLLTSFDQTVLKDPFVSVKKKGRVPRRPKVFSVRIPCVGNASGIATFGIGLRIQTKRGKKGAALPGTPLRLRLRKRCELAGGPDPACDEKCANGGVCDEERRCRCPLGYMGQFCNVALCYPQCRNGGTCSSPGRCTCPSGYHGRICEGGICRNKCLNGGKCIQKDTCACQRGYYGNRCEFSKCVIPCVNGGRCRGVNKCRCRPGYSGDHCEIITTRGLNRLHSRCTTRCRHGTCIGHGNCQCSDGYTGRWCRRRGRWKKRKNRRRRPKLWV